MRDSARRDDHVVRGGAPAAPSQPAVPRQLPPAPAYFTSRDSELNLVDKIVDGCARAGRLPFVILTGSGGVGKSALALHWLYREIELFPDGQLYADLGGFSSAGPTAPTTVLNLFLRSLGVPVEEIPPELSQQSALYRSVTADKSLAVLADDAVSAAQLKLLQPSSTSCAMLVTSRWRLGAAVLDGGHILQVEALDESSAVELLAQAAGHDRVLRDPAAARRLAELCAGLPIALRVTAAQLVIRPQWSLTRVVDRLADRRSRLASLSVSEEISVEANFDLSYRELSAGTARLYRLLGLHPGPDFRVGAAAAIGGIPDDEAEESLAELVDANLVGEAGDERYRLHDLLRLHAERLAQRHDSDAERAAAELRLVSWYLDTAVAVDLAVMPQRRRLGPRYEHAATVASPAAGPAAALDELERELPNLAAAQRLAMDREWYEPAWQLCEALWSLFLYRKHFDYWRDFHDRGRVAARACGNQAAESRLSIQLGFAQLNLRQHAAAAECFSDALELGRRSRDRHAEATALEHLGLVARATGRWHDAMDHFGQALAISEELGERRGVALHLRRLGETLSDLGREREAVTHLNRAVAAATAIGDSVLRARGLTRLGAVHAKLGATNAALDCLDEAVDILSDAGSHQYLAEAHETLADVHHRAGDRAASLANLRLALDVYRRARLPRADQVRDRLDQLTHPRPPAVADDPTSE